MPLLSATRAGLHAMSNAMVSDLFVNEQELDERGFTLLPQLASTQDLAEFEARIAEFCEAQLKLRGISPINSDPFVDVMRADPNYRKYLLSLLPRFQVVQRISTEIGMRLADDGFLKRRNIRVPLIWPYMRADLPDE